MVFTRKTYLKKKKVQEFLPNLDSRIFTSDSSSAIQGRAHHLMLDGCDLMNSSSRRRKKTRRKQNTELQNQILQESQCVEA